MNNKKLLAFMGKATESKNRNSTKQPQQKQALCENYETLFMQSNKLKDRKAIYISRELHEHIAHFLGATTAGALSAGVYVENIIMSHFEQHKSAMCQVYESKYKNNFQQL